MSRRYLARYGCDDEQGQLIQDLYYPERERHDYDDDVYEYCDDGIDSDWEEPEEYFEEDDDLDDERKDE